MDFESKEEKVQYFLLELLDCLIIFNKIIKTDFYAHKYKIIVVSLLLFLADLLIICNNFVHI